MYWLCMIATIPLATGNKLNCFISARGMLAIVWHCVLLFCCFLLLIFYMLINHLLKKKKIYIDRELVHMTKARLLIVLIARCQRVDTRLMQFKILFANIANINLI